MGYNALASPTCNFNQFYHTATEAVSMQQLKGLTFPPPSSDQMYDFRGCMLFASQFVHFKSVKEWQISSKSKRHHKIARNVSLLQSVTGLTIDLLSTYCKPKQMVTIYQHTRPAYLGLHKTLRKQHNASGQWQENNYILGETHWFPIPYGLEMDGNQSMAKRFYTEHISPHLSEPIRKGLCKSVEQRSNCQGEQ